MSLVHLIKINKTWFYLSQYILLPTFLFQSSTTLFLKRNRQMKQNRKKLTTLFLLCMSYGLCNLEIGVLGSRLKMFQTCCRNKIFRFNIIFLLYNQIKVYKKKNQIKVSFF